LSFESIRLLLTYEPTVPNLTASLKEHHITWFLAQLSLRRYMAALTERDRFIAMMEQFLAGMPGCVRL